MFEPEENKESPDYYKLLGLEKGATSAEIKKAYRKQALLFHPDKSKAADCQERMKLLNEAYSILSDVTKRQAYDEELDAAEQEDEKPVQAAGYISNSHIPFSQEYRAQHEQLVKKFSLTPLEQASAWRYFKPFNLQTDKSSIEGKLEEKSEKKDEEQKAEQNLFEWSYINKGRLPIGTLEVLNKRLTPNIAILIFIEFLNSKYDVSQIKQIISYLIKGSEKIKALTPYAAENLLYEGILEIISINEIQLGHEDALLLAIKKIIDYAKDDAVQTMPFCAPLFQSHQFRQLFSKALHLYWHYNSKVFNEKDLQVFNGQEAAHDLLHGLKLRASSDAEEREVQKKLQELTHYVRLLYYFEKDLHDKEPTDPSAAYFRQLAFHILDWMPSIFVKAGQQIVVNIFIQTGIYFQRASRREEVAALQMADEKLALRMYLIAIGIAGRATPDIDLYAHLQSLKYIAAFKFQDPELDEIIPILQRHTMSLADIFPFFQAGQSNIEFLREENRYILLMRQFLHVLVDIIEKNKLGGKQISIDHKYAEVLYHAYDATLRQWYEEKYDPEAERKLRLGLMQELLRQNKWTTADVERNLFFPLMRQRTKDGLFKSDRFLSLPSHRLLTKFRSLDGVEINYKTGTTNFIFKTPRSDAPKYEEALTILDVHEIFQRNITGGIFSLDPVDPDKLYHPFNKMRFAPKRLYRTQMFDAMLLTDYLLKFFTLGQEVQGKFPYDMRSLAALTKNLPEYLRKILDDFQQAPHPAESLNRFWIEAEEIPIAVSDETIQKDGIQRIALGEMRMVVKKHQMSRDIEGKLVDKEEDGEGWDCYGLTLLQKRELDAKQRIILGNAMVFIHGTNEVYFVEDGFISPVFLVKGCDRHLARLYKYKKDEQGKFIIDSQNLRLVYKITREIAEQSGRHHRFTPEFIFAQEFTAHYNEFAQYFPEFGRLRELSRVVVLARIMTGIQKGVQEKIAELEKLVGDTQHWQARRLEVQKAIDSMRSKYNDDYKEEYEHTYDKLKSSFEVWRKECIRGKIYNKKRSTLYEIRKDIGSVAFSHDSPEVTRACNDIYEKFREDVIRQFGYSVWEAQSNAIWSEISSWSKKQEMAVTLTNAKRQNCREQLDRIFSPILTDLGRYTYNQLIEGFIDGRIEPLLEALVDHEIKHAKQQMQEALGVPLIDIEGALANQPDALSRITTKVTDKKLSRYRSSMEDEVAKAEKIVDTDRAMIKQHVVEKKRLSSHFARLGFFERKESEDEKKADFSRYCFWVPANIRHRVNEHSSRLVYGGVHVEPHVEVIPQESPMHQATIDTAFSGEGTYREPNIGDQMYRIYGGESGPYGRSWTTVDPNTVDNFRDAAGLPNVNTGQFVIEGILKDTQDVTVRSALPYDGNRGGLSETVVANPEKQIEITRVSGANPEF